MNSLQNIDRLIRLISDNSSEAFDALKRLSTLAIADRKQFSVYAKKVAPLLEPFLNEFQASVVLSSLTLLSSLLSQSSREIQAVVRLRLLPNVVKYIGHKEGLVRKTAHNVFLVSLKTFKNMDQVLQLYMSQGLGHPESHIRQKVTNSLQSLLITEAKQLNYSSQDFKRVIDKLLGLWQTEDQSSVKRAIQQCLNTICKSTGIKSTVKALNKSVLHKLQIYFYRQRDMGNFSPQTCIQDQESQRQFLNRSIAKPLPVEPKLQSVVKQTIQEPAQVSSGQIKVSLELITNERDWKIRLQTIQKVAQKINKEKNKPQFQNLAKTILPLLVGLISDSNFKVSLLAVRIIQTILQHKQSRALAQTYLPMFIEKLADNKLSVRQAVFRILKSDYMRQNKGQYIQKLLQTLSRTGNQSLKEQVLTLLSQIFAEEVLQADLISNVLKDTIPFLQDPNTKIKIRALDCITAVASKSQKAFETSRKFLQPRISKLYFEMFMEKCKIFVKGKQVKQDQRKASSSVGVLSRYYSKQSSRQKPMPNYASQIELKSQASKRHSQKQRDRDNKPQELILPKINKGFRKPAGSFLRKKDVLTDTSASEAGLSRKHISSKMSENPQKFKSRLKKSDYADFRSENNESFHTLSMAPFQNPQNQLRKILGQLKSQDWQRNLQGLQVMKRLLTNHTTVFNSSNVKSISHELCNLAESLRSNLAKNSLMTICLLGSNLRRMMDSQIQMMMGRLLRRSMDANNFICQQVRKALITLSENCSEQNVLLVLSSYYNSRSQAIKLSIVQIVSAIVSNPRYIPKQGQRIIRILNSFLNEGSSEIRIQAKQVLSDLVSRGHQDLLKRFLQQENYKKLSLLQIKKESINKPQTNFVLKEPNKSVDSLFKSSDIVIQSPISSKQEMKIKKATMPNQLNDLDESCVKMSDPISKNRLQGLKQGVQLAVKYKQFVYFHRSFLKFFDSVNKMQGDPNSQVQRAASQAMMLLVSQASKQICQSYSNVILNDLVGMLHREGVDQVFELFISKSGVPSVGQYLLNALNFAIPKLKNTILLKIQRHFDKLMQKNGFKKGLLGVLDKFCDEIKPQIVGGLKAVILKLEQNLGEEAFKGRRQSLRKFLF